MTQGVEQQRVLLVEAAPRERSDLHGHLARDYPVATARGAREALELLARDPEFAVLICDEELPDLRGSELLARARERAPELVGILLSAVPRLELDVRWLDRGCIHRCLPRSCPPEELRVALDAALDLHGERREAGARAWLVPRARAGASRLERRVQAQTESLRRLHRFAVELNGACCIRDMAELAGLTLHELLGRRGIHVQIWEPGWACVDCGLGPEMTSRLHSEPLRTPDGPVGELVVDELDPRGRPLTPVERETLVSIASSTAVAVHNEWRRRERDEAQYATIVALARLAEQRDCETGRHLERVSRYCVLLAEGLRAAGHHRERISDAWIRDLERSAPLHDIGKVGIPDAILLKPGRLSQSEWEIMKTHASIGAETLKSVIAERRGQGFLEMGYDITLSHHERWDGEGYPRGTRGEEIPLAARILAMADVYDALTTTRPYKEAWSHEAAMEWIRQSAGTQFDPLLVEVFLEHERQADEIRTRLADGDAALAARVRSTIERAT